MPANITLAGENTYTIYIRESLKVHIGSSVVTYQTDARRDGGGKRGDDVHSWVQTLRQSLIAAARFVKILELDLVERQ